MLHLNVLLARNRNKQGWLRVERDGQPVAEFRVLGRGSRGPGNTAFLEHGNTPTGAYQGTFEATDGWDQSKYGPWGAVRLTPTSGDALLAQDVFGRRGLLVHGGHLASSGPWKGSLMPTLGCLRLLDSDVLRLRAIVDEASKDTAQSMSVAPEIRVTVREW
jgi:hypothetical protein